MSEKNNPTETEIIREQVKRVTQCMRRLNEDPGLTDEEIEQLGQEAGEAMRLIDQANEARDKSRVLSGVSVTVPGYTEEHYRSVLSIGFALGVKSFRQRLDNASCCSGDCFGSCGVADPKNPFLEDAKPDH